MPRNRSASASATSSPALLSRGFASIRRRLSASTPPTSPNSPVDKTKQTLPPRLKLVPNIGATSRGFVFDVIDKELEPNVIYHIGRFSERNAAPDRFSFKSKVVSRNQAELWSENGKVYIKDVGSSGGTFLNRLRLSAPQHTSLPHEIRDGDLLQFGIDYQGGVQQMYRAVRIRVEINRPTASHSPYTHTAFQQLRSQLISTSPDTADLTLDREPTKIHEHSDDMIVPAQQFPTTGTHMTKSDIQECCICLYAIAPFQALFAAPCSHLFHFKCISPILCENYPGFSCPLCRGYYDIEASVAVEVDEVLEVVNYAKELQQQQQQQQQTKPKHETVLEEENEDDDVSLNEETTASVARSSSSVKRERPSDNIMIPSAAVPSISITGESSKNETYLSRTLVGSPMFDHNVVSSSATNNHA